MDETQWDVIVVGGGTAGVVAAAQAGRLGARVLLVEKNGLLGGTITSAGVAFPGLFHAWGKQVIAGIGWDLVRRCVEECGGTLPDFSNPRQPHPSHHVPVERAVFAALCDEAVLEAGVELLLHAMPAEVEAADGGGWRVRVCTKTGLETVRAAALVDCTGDANVVTLAGGPIRVHEPVQPATLVCGASGYDMSALDLDELNRRFEAEVCAGRLAYTDASWNMQAAEVGKWLRKRGFNASHVHGINARDSRGRTRLELEGRRSVLRLYRFLKAQPGLEGLRLDYMADECGVRETATIVGETTVSVEDYTSGRAWPDGVCHAFYPIDLHVSSGSGLACRSLADGVVPSVPRGALLVRGCTNLIAAGRCISSDRLANSALRVQAASMATGQAAGAMAALSAESGVSAGELPIERVREVLAEHGAILPPLAEGAQ